MYAALAAGEVDAERFAELLVAYRGGAGAPVFAMDVSTWARCDAACSPERGFHYSPSRHSTGQPIVAGSCYSWIAQLSWARDSWTAAARGSVLDTPRPCSVPHEQAVLLTMHEVVRRPHPYFQGCGGPGDAAVTPG